MAEKERQRNDSQETNAPEGQHALIGVASSATADDGFVRNDHPGALWFGQAALGLFVHFGISAVHGDIDLSWGMLYGKPWEMKLGLEKSIPPRQYFALAERFRPERFEPERWLAAAAEAGCQYAVFTARHHDGFAMWPSRHGGFNTGTHGDGSDYVRRFVDACRRTGLRVGLYFSPPDWHFNAPYMSFHYGSGEDNGAIKFPERAHFGLDHEPIALPAKPADWQQRYEAYVRAQLTELLSDYGQVDLLWFDGGRDLAGAMSVAEIRELQPAIVINGRMHGTGDFDTFECRLPTARPDGWWEHCDIWAEGPWWGDVASSADYRPAAWMLATLSRVRADGGSFLVNVGPRADGELPQTAYDRLAEVKSWMAHSGEAIFGAEPGDGSVTSQVPLTRKGDIWYAHVPPDMELPLAVELACGRTLVEAWLLRDGTKLSCGNRDGGGRWTIEGMDGKRSGLVDIVAFRFG
ncbi:MAG: alpha-L-fucosidase [Paenibacillaceae bacterium]|nr:alpha-L-fucosidase [Paenibacillaceae bacterium]